MTSPANWHHTGQALKLVDDIEVEDLVAALDLAYAKRIDGFLSGHLFVERGELGRHRSAGASRRVELGLSQAPLGEQRADNS